jgi:hypothetical protein
MIVDAVIETFGPFLIPATVFAVGAVGYGLLILLSRYGLVPEKESEEAGNEHP